MNVYALKALGNYAGGMAIVAADTEDDAKQLAGRVVDSMYQIQWGNPYEINLLPVSYYGEPKVLEYGFYGE